MTEERITFIKLVKIGTILFALYFVFNFVRDEVIDYKSEKAMQEIEKNDTLGMRTRGGQHYDPFAIDTAKDTVKTIKK